MATPQENTSPEKGEGSMFTLNNASSIRDYFRILNAFKIEYDNPEGCIPESLKTRFKISYIGAIGMLLITICTFSLKQLIMPTVRFKARITQSCCSSI